MLKIVQSVTQKRGQKLPKNEKKLRQRIKMLLINISHFIHITALSMQHAIKLFEMITGIHVKVLVDCNIKY